MAKTPLWQRNGGKNPKGGLNAACRRSEKAQGMNLKAPVKSGDNPRRASFLARMGNARGPEYKDGKPTRLLLSLRAWGASSKAEQNESMAISKEQSKKRKDSKCLDIMVGPIMGFCIERKERNSSNKDGLTVKQKLFQKFSRC